MYTRNAFLSIVFLLAMMTGCTSSPDVSKSIDSPSSADASEKPAAATRPNMQWPPPAAQQATPEPPAPLLPSRILTKDAQYRALVKPPTGDEFLKAYSAEYNAKLAEVETNIAHLSDASLREKARIDGWKNVDKSNLQRQATEAHATQLREYMSKHRDGLIEIGHCDYDPATKILKVYSIPASPFQTSDKFEVHIDIAAMDAVYNKFRVLAEPRVSARIDQDVMEYFAQEESPVYSRDQVTKFLRVQRYDTYETRIRQEQMVVVGQGDLASKNIQHVSLVDYATETVLLELDPKAFLASNPTWLY